MTETEKTRKLIFHIGHHKTGTTSIQYAFATGRVKLDGGRILYPGKLTHNYLRKHVQAYARNGTILTGSPGFPNLPAVSERLKQGNFDVAVLSGEHFEGADPVHLRQVLKEFMLPHVTDHTVVCYVRPYGGRIVSSFSENLKIGAFSGPLDEFAQKSIQSRRFHYSEHLASWAETFGDRLQVRPMIRAELVNGDILQDFVRTGFGPDAAVTIEPGTAANESLCVEDLLIVKLLHDGLAPTDQSPRHSMGWELAEALTEAVRKGGPGTKLKLHKSLAETIRATYIEDAEAMDARFFGGRQLFRDDLDRSVDEALPEAQSLDPADYFSEDTLRIVSVLVSQMAMLVENETGNWAHFLRDRRIAKLHGELPGPVFRKAASGKAVQGRNKVDLPLKKLGKRKKAGKAKARANDDLAM